MGVWIYWAHTLRIVYIVESILLLLFNPENFDSPTFFSPRPPCYGCPFTASYRGYPGTTVLQGCLVLLVTDCAVKFLVDCGRNRPWTHHQCTPPSFHISIRRYRVQSPDNTPTLGSQQEGQMKGGIEESRKGRIEWKSRGRNRERERELLREGVGLEFETKFLRKKIWALIRDLG